MHRNLLPFSSIVGQEKAKQALIYCLINPAIGGVLLSGQKGCAKSTIVRSLAYTLDNIDVVDIPLNTTEDMLIGSIDIDAAIKTGKKALSPGILDRADKNILYIDEVNLLSDSIVNILLDVSESGINQIEREGLSFSHSSDFVIVGTMNPEEGLLRSEFSDRFGLYVELKGLKQADDRKKIIKERLLYENNPSKAASNYRLEDENIAKLIKQAQTRVKEVIVKEEAYDYAVKLVKTASVAGHRADIILAQAAKAIAAWQGKNEAGISDIKEAATFVLPHRMRDQKGQEDAAPEYETKEQNSTPRKEEQRREGYDKSSSMEFDADILDEIEHNGIGMDDQLVKGQDIYTVRDLTELRSDRRKRKGSGTRSKTISSTNKGRYIGYSFPKQGISDIALDATLRAASIHQKERNANGLAFKVEDQDIRIKKREHRIGATIIFVVDASGSMGAKKRMIATKEAILSLLNDAYQKRDRIGLIAFRKESAEILLPITRSVDLAQKMLQELPTGGRTPLSEGLMLAWQMIYTQKIKDKDMIPLLVLVTDGRANSKGGEAVHDAFRSAKTIANADIPSVVIDTETGMFQLGLAKELAGKMNARYIKTEQLRASDLESVVR